MPVNFLNAIDESLSVEALEKEYDQIIQGDYPLDEDMRDFVHGALDVVGFIPGVGEAADALNALLYLSKNPPDYLLASLSAISCIPTIGDIIGKGGKLAVWAAKASARLPKTSRLAGQATRILRDLKKLIHENYDKVVKVFEFIERPPQEGQKDYFAKIRPHAQRMKDALRVFTFS